MYQHINSTTAPKGKSETLNQGWNLGDGLRNVAWSLLDKANAASWRLENSNRTIINVDSYEAIVMIRALSEYIEKYDLRRDS